MGSVDGVAVGWLDGCALGLELGDEVGSAVCTGIVGCADGASVGGPVGCCEGEADGSAVGCCLSDGP